MCGDDKQGQLSGAVELPKLGWVWLGTAGPGSKYHRYSVMWAGTKTTSTWIQVTSCVRFVRIHTAICRAGDSQAPHKLGEQMHKGPLIGHPLPLQRKRMCQRHPLAAWPPGRGGIRRPKRPSSHGGAGPGSARRWSGSQKRLLLLWADLAKRPLSQRSFDALRYTLSHSALPITILAISRHQASGPVRDVHMLTHASNSVHPQPERHTGSRGMTLHDTT